MGTSSYDLINTIFMFGDFMLTEIPTETDIENTVSSVLPEIKDVIFNDPATIVLWADGTKTIVKCQKKTGDVYSRENGLKIPPQIKPTEIIRMFKKKKKITLPASAFKCQTNKDVKDSTIDYILDNCRRRANSTIIVYLKDTNEVIKVSKRFLFKIGNELDRISATEIIFSNQSKILFKVAGKANIDNIIVCV